MASQYISPAAQRLGLYSTIQSAVEEFASTADLWDVVKSSGIPATFAEVNQLRSMAASTRNARTTLNSALDTQAITRDMIGTSPWARSLSAQSLAPSYQLNIPYTYTNTEGNEVTDWVSKTVSVLPAAVGDLIDMANGIVSDLDTAPPDATVTGGIEILAV